MHCTKEGRKDVLCLPCSQRCDCRHTQACFHLAISHADDKEVAVAQVSVAEQLPQVPWVDLEF